MSSRRAATSKARRADPKDGVKLGDGVATTVGIVAGCAGILHLLAARDHLEHPPVAAFFIVLALAQIGWAAAVVWQRSSRLLLLGILGNLSVVAIWAFSRTTGLPFYEAVAEAEPVGIADATATMFELIAVLGAGGLLVLPVTARLALVPRQPGQRFMAGAGVLALLMLVPAFVTESPAHDHSNEVQVAGVSHAHEEAAALAEDVHAHPKTALAEAAMHSKQDHSHAVAQPAGAGNHAHEDGEEHGDVAAQQEEQAHAGGTQESSPAAVPAQPPPRGQAATMLYGPFVLDPADQGGLRHYNRILPLLPPCVNCLITSIRPDLVYTDGTSANLNTGPMLHHTVLADPFRPDPTCSRDDGVGVVGHRVFASGNERTSGTIPSGFGFANQSPVWIGIFEIMNHAPESKLVWFKIDITHVPMSDPSTRAVVPVWLDVDNCADSQFAIPKGESHTKWKWKSNLTGRIVGTGGHVHDGGISITLSNATRNERMCTSLAGYGTKPQFMGSVESMTTCMYDRIGTVKAGEDLLLDTHYNATSAADDVMGIMIAYVYETNDLTGGSPPPAAYTAPPPDDAPMPQTHTDHGH